MHFASQMKQIKGTALERQTRHQRFTLTVLSSEPVSSQLPSEEKLTERTVPVWALSSVERPSLRGATRHTVVSAS